MKAFYDAVVIGSGFGGAITACRLAQAGRSVCILERGRKWEKSEFPRTLGQMKRAFWNHEDYGLLDYRVFRRIDVIQASGVGGGSLVYFNVHRRAKPEIFSQSRWPRNITREALNPYYDRAKEMLEARPLTPRQGFPLPERTKSLLAFGQKAGRAPELMDICVYTGPARLNPFGKVPQEPCVYCGNCMLGCHVHAKNTLDLNYIPLAQSNGAELYPLHEAFKIEPADDPKAGYRVSFRHFSDEPNEAPELSSVAGGMVIIAAGALGSTELLLRCKDQHRSLPRISPALGHGFSGNGDFLIPATDHLKEEVDAAWGPSITAGMDLSTSEHQMYLQDLGIPDPFFWFLEGAVPRGSTFSRAWRLLEAYSLRMLGLGMQTPVSIGLERLFEGSLVRALPYLGMGADDADGSMRLADNELDVVWPRQSSRRMFAEMEKALEAISAAAGGKYQPSPLWKWPLRKLLTAHPLGGCAMADDPQSGVVNEFGEVWNYPNLFVADGSAIPTALAINPSATISALAERAAEHIINGTI